MNTQGQRVQKSVKAYIVMHLSGCEVQYNYCNHEHAVNRHKSIIFQMLSCKHIKLFRITLFKSYEIEVVDLISVSAS